MCVNVVCGVVYVLLCVFVVCMVCSLRRGCGRRVCCGPECDV